VTVNRDYDCSAPSLEGEEANEGGLLGAVLEGNRRLPHHRLLGAALDGNSDLPKDCAAPPGVARPAVVLRMTGVRCGGVRSSVSPHGSPSLPGLVRAIKRTCGSYLTQDEQR
jgi:hypothetical protein